MLTKDQIWAIKHYRDNLKITIEEYTDEEQKLNFYNELLIIKYTLREYYRKCKMNKNKMIGARL
jgi:hypothetical protein